MLETYLESQRQHYSATTLAITRMWLERLQSFLGTELVAASPARLADWHRELAWRPGPGGRCYSKNTVNQAVGAVRRFYRWARAEGLVSRDPCAKLKTPHVPKEPRPKLDPPQLKKLLGATDPTTATGTRNRALLGLLVETGIAGAACSRLDLEHLQTDTGALLSNGRGRRRLHSLSAELVEDLKRYLDFGRPALARPGETALFVSRYGERLTPAAVRHVVAEYARAAGVPRP